jgi:hypothetical protein
MARRYMTGAERMTALIIVGSALVAAHRVLAIWLLVAIPILIGLIFWIWYAATRARVAPSYAETDRNGRFTDDEHMDFNFSASDESDDEMPEDSEEKVPQHREWFEILGVDFRASPEEIRAARNRLVRQYHPDRLESVEGLSPDFEALANQKLVEINAAYEEAKIHIASRTSKSQKRNSGLGGRQRSSSAEDPPSSKDNRPNATSSNAIDRRTANLRVKREDRWR